MISNVDLQGTGTGRARARAGVVLLAAALVAGGIPVGSPLWNLDPAILTAIAGLPQILTIAGVGAWWWLFSDAPRMRLTMIVLVAASLVVQLPYYDRMVALASGDLSVVEDNALLPLVTALAMAGGMVIFAHLVSSAFRKLGKGLAADRWRFMRWVYAVGHGVLPLVGMISATTLFSLYQGTAVDAAVLVVSTLFSLVVGIALLIFHIRALWTAWKALEPPPGANTDPALPAP